MKPPVICLYPECVSNLQKTVEIGKKARYQRVVVPITNPPLSQSEPFDHRTAFTRSDLLLDATTWSQNTILKISDFNDQCDNDNEAIRKKAIQNLKLEIDWAKHQNSDTAIVLVSLKSDQSTNMARQLLNRFDTFGLVLAEMPLVDKSYFTQKYTKQTENKTNMELASTKIWDRWNRFRFTVDFNAQFKVALELTPELPNESDLSRWFGEPVHLIIIPSNLFKMTNNNNGIYLDEHFRNVCLKFFRKTATHFAVRCNSDDPRLQQYSSYLHNLFVMAAKSDNHVCNKINKEFNEAGLIFSSKPNEIVNCCEKYQKVLFKVYTKAIRLAIADRLQADDKMNIMLCGLSSWKLLAPLVELIENSRTVEIFIYEEDPNLQILLSDVIESLYVDIKITIINNSETEKYHRKMDIVVSVTQSAVYESQWLQVNFSRVGKYIRSDAILIPSQSSLSVVPVLTANAYTYLQRCPQLRHGTETHGFERHEVRSQIVCPIYTRNFYECSAIQELFSFRYRLGDMDILSDHRYKKLTFQIHRDCVVTGIQGYFEATLYKDIKISNQAWLRDDNADCVPAVYFPLRTPQTIKGQTEMNIAFQLFGCVDKKMYWYEWQTIAPFTTGHQNLSGKSCSFQYSSDNM